MSMGALAYSTVYTNSLPKTARAVLYSIGEKNLFCVIPQLP